MCLGCKYLDPNFIDDGKNMPKTNLDGENTENQKGNSKTNINRKESFKLNKEKTKDKKKRFC